METMMLRRSQTAQKGRDVAFIVRRIYDTFFFFLFFFPVLSFTPRHSSRHLRAGLCSLVKQTAKAALFPAANS